MMDQLKTLQEFIVAWMDELWWSMRDRVGALSIIESLQNSWNAAGNKVGKLAKTEGLDIVKAVEFAHTILGRTTKVQDSTVLVTMCPFWNQILAGQLEYGLRCEEFICAPFLTGIKEGIGGIETTVETNLRLAYVARARLEHKLEKLKVADISEPKVNAQIADLEKQLSQLPSEPACVFHVK